MIFDRLLPESTGNRQESNGKNPINFRSEYCFHFRRFPGLSCRILRDPVAAIIDLGTYIQYIKKDFFPKEPNLEEQNRQNTIKSILYTCLNNSFRLTVPIMPYFCEELYQRLPQPNNGQNSPPSLCVTQDHESDNGSNTKPIGIRRNPTLRISSDSPKKSDKIQQKNPILRIESDSATRIPIGPSIGLMYMDTPYPQSSQVNIFFSLISFFYNYLSSSLF